MTSQSTSMNIQTIACNCTSCDGNQAQVRGSVKYTATAIHNLVAIAHSNFRFAPQQIANGPWPLGDF